MSSAPAETTVISHLLDEDPEIPNNPRLPVLIYPGAVALSGNDPAAIFESLFAGNGWVGAWRNGIFPFHHYHSTAHEVLGVYSGTATARLGGESGVVVTMGPGDVVIIPAGVGHKRLSEEGGLGIVGAYPRGQQPDMCRADARARERGAVHVSAVPVPTMDPVFGEGGPARPALGSVAPRRIHHVVHGLAGDAAIQVVAEHLRRHELPAVIDAGAVRGHDHVLHVPERTLGR